MLHVIVPVFLCVFALVLLRHRQKSRQLPPGPPNWSVLAHSNKDHIHKTYSEWAKQYGPIFSYHLGKTPVVVLASVEKAWDLLEKRGEIYSSRPRQIMGHELLSGSMRGGSAPYGEKWRKWRKIMHIGMSGRQAITYKPFQTLECSVLLRDIMRDSDSYVAHFQRFATSIVISISYGIRISSLDDQLVKDNLHATSFSQRYTVQGAYLVESYPILLKLPLALQWFRREPDRIKNWIGDLYLRLLRDVADKMRHGVARESCSSRVLGPGKNMGMTELELAWAVSSPFRGGVGTTRASFLVFFLAMFHYPQVLKKAREEIDTVVGKDRMPTFNDEKSLPYIVALIKEVTRWKPIAPVGVAHSITEDDYYDGFLIPKGATIWASIYDMTRDPNLFPDPDVFRPERFLETSNPRLQDFDLPFGFGRRICPGVHVVYQSLFITISRILWAFDMVPAIGADGRAVLPDLNAFVGTLVVEPAPFTIRFIPRSSAIESLIEAEASEADVQLKAWD